MSRRPPRDISMLLNELIRVNQLQGPAVFDHTEGLITWALGKGWDFDQEKYDAVKRYWHDKTSEDADQRRAKDLIDSLLQDENDVFYDIIFESMLHSDFMKFSSKMQLYWKMGDEKAWERLTQSKKNSECRKKWNSSGEHGLSKRNKLWLLLSNNDCTSMFCAMISSPKIVACMYRKWVLNGGLN